MALLDSYVAEPPPLVETEQGAIRMRGTRVPLDAVVYSYKSGATPEQIVQSYPPLNLRDIYAAITYYLDHRDLVDGCLERREAEAAEIERRIGANQATNEEFRARLLARQGHRVKAGVPS